jgi:hypothetical protein
MDSDVPIQMQSVRTAVQQCQVRLEWVAVNDEDTEPIDEYQVKIKARNQAGEQTDQFVEYTACGSNQ